MAKAAKIKAIHADCPACGIRISINSETGEVAAFVGGKDPPVSDPPGNEGDPEPNGEPTPDPTPDPETGDGDPAGEGKDVDEDDKWKRGSW